MHAILHVRPYLVLVFGALAVEKVLGGVLVEYGDWVLHLDVELVKDVVQFLPLCGNQLP